MIKIIDPLAPHPFTRLSVGATVLLTMLLLSGCATEPKVYRFPEIGIDVAFMYPNGVKHACAPAQEGKWDDGTYRPAGIKGAGQACYNELTGMIILPYGASAMLLLHELAHAVGRSPEECDKL